VWTVAALPNDDIVVGGSDAVVRVFTRQAERTAVPEALKVRYLLFKNRQL
jgi:phospholipase A-2-activating protein